MQTGHPACGRAESYELTQGGQLADGGPKAWDHFAMATSLPKKWRRKGGVKLRNADFVAHETQREGDMKPALNVLVIVNTQAPTNQH